MDCSSPGLDARGRKQYRYHDDWRLQRDVEKFDHMLDFAKSGKRRIQSVADPDVLDVVRELKARRGGGPELLAWRTGSSWVDVKSVDVNAYIKEATGGDFSAKDFRTWGATTVMDALACLDEESGLGGLHTHGAIEKAVLALLSDEDAAAFTDDAASAAA